MIGGLIDEIDCRINCGVVLDTAWNYVIRGGAVIEQPGQDSPRDDRREYRNDMERQRTRIQARITAIGSEWAPRMLAALGDAEWGDDYSTTVYCACHIGAEQAMRTLRYWSRGNVAQVGSRLAAVIAPQVAAIATVAKSLVTTANVARDMHEPGANDQVGLGQGAVELAQQLVHHAAIAAARCHILRATDLIEQWYRAVMAAVAEEISVDVAA